MKSFIVGLTLFLSAALSGCMSTGEMMAAVKYQGVQYGKQQFNSGIVSYHYFPAGAFKQPAQLASRIPEEFYKQTIFIHKLIPIDNPNDSSLDEAASILKRGMGTVGGVVLSKVRADSPNFNILGSEGYAAAIVLLQESQKYYLRIEVPTDVNVDSSVDASVVYHKVEIPSKFFN